MKKIVLIFFCCIFINSCINKKEKAQEYMMSGLIKSDNSNFNDALKDYDLSIKFDSTNAKVWYLRGCIKISLKMFNEAIIDFNKAILLNDKYTDAYYNCGYAYSILGNADKACENYFIAFKMGKPNIEDKIIKCKEIR